MGCLFKFIFLSCLVCFCLKGGKNTTLLVETCWNSAILVETVTWLCCFFSTRSFEIIWSVSLLEVSS